MTSRNAAKPSEILDELDLIGFGRTKGRRRDSSDRAKFKPSDKFTTAKPVNRRTVSAKVGKPV